MTKFNWERASKLDRHFRVVFAPDRPADRPLDLNISPKRPAMAELQNPLGLTEGDCFGKVPDIEIRVKIFTRLVQTESALKELIFNEAVLLDEDVSGVSRSRKAFKSFCRLVALNCEIDSSSEGNYWPIAVCLSVFYLDFYNSVIAKKGERVSELSWEIWTRIKEFDTS